MLELENYRTPNVKNLLIQFERLKNLAQQKDSNRAIKKEPKLK